MYRTSYAYVVIRKSDSICVQINQNNNPNWILDNENVFNILVDPAVCEQYLDKYYYDNKWYNRVWNEYTTDENGETVPVESAGYVDHEWEPTK